MKKIKARLRQDFSKMQWTLTIPGHLADRLLPHLFPGDEDEHGAIIQAGISQLPEGPRLLARDVILAKDGIDYVPGQRGYRMLTAEFVTKQILRCRNENLVYLAVHNHGGGDSVEFSVSDLQSQRRGYPALLDVMGGLPVGALVFSRNAVAGKLWLSSSVQIDLHSARVLGPSIRWLYPKPPKRPPNRANEYDRQARIFGDRGQDILSRMTVGIIGAGGVGSLVVELLARLGAGSFIIVDPERLDLTNVPRVTGSTRWDAMAMLTESNRPKWLQHMGSCFATPKVKIMKRLIRRANPQALVECIKGDFVDDEVARRFVFCDYLFLVADSMQARLVFNAIVHTYLIPGVQIGAKVPVDKETGEVGDVYSVSRLVTPSGGCLWCNGLITPAGLQREAENEAERRLQRYVEEDGIVAPSVITLNATAASHAVNDFLFSMTGLTDSGAQMEYIRIRPMNRRLVYDKPRKDINCPHCGVESVSTFARGDNGELQTRKY